jgi:ATP-dependent helicase/nuclease subunit A
MSQPTPQQQAAITATGGVLLSAGAGTGKTATLIARGLRLILEEGVNVDELLVVTFTNAAAEEMKQRLREALQARLAGQPEDARLRQQVLLLEGAHISTIHSFCFELLRAHFAELQLDPGVVVLEESITRPLEKTIARQVVLRSIDQPAVCQLAQLYCRDSGEQLAEQIR